MNRSAAADGRLLHAAGRLGEEVATDAHALAGEVADRRRPGAGEPVAAALVGRVRRRCPSRRPRSLRWTRSWRCRAGRCRRPWPCICAGERGSFSAPGRRQMWLGHSSAGDETVAIWPLVPPIGDGAELAGAADVLVFAGSAHREHHQRQCKQRETPCGRRDRNRGGREPHGDSLASGGTSRERRRLAPTGGTNSKARKAAPCYLHDRSCQASAVLLTRAAIRRKTHSSVARSGEKSREKKCGDDAANLLISGLNLLDTKVRTSVA